MFDAGWAGRVALVGMPPSDLAASIDRGQIAQALWACCRTPPRRAGDKLAFQVSDNGAGVLSEARAQLFKPFFTTKPAGNGVELSLARQIAHSHGGDLTHRGKRWRSFRTQPAAPESAGASFGLAPGMDIHLWLSKHTLAPTHGLSHSQLRSSSRRPKNLGPFQCVPAIADATAVRLRKRWPA